MKKVIFVFLSCFLLLGVFVGGVCLGRFGRLPSAEEHSERNLLISVTDDWKGGFTTIPVDSGKYREISWLNLKNVTIEIDGIPMKLEDAVQNGYTSIDEIIANARKDADVGFCHEVAKSKNGLTEFFYYYPEFNIHSVYDIYETPDGKKHLISDFLIYSSGSDPHFIYTWDENGNPIDYEDWGLRFDVSQADSGSVTISCSQYGGQQLGRLSVDCSWLDKKDPDTSDFKLVEPLGEAQDPVPASELVMEGETEFHIDLSELYGGLPSGDYVLTLQIVDRYNKEEIPTLMRKYHDSQNYAVEFTIP